MIPQPSIPYASEGLGLLHGRVRAASDRHFAVSTERGEFLAERADGCLLRPRPGDLVLLSADSQESFVLSVLRRADRNAFSELDFPGTVALRARGDMHFLADGDLNAAAGKAMSLTAETAEARFGEASLLVKTLRTTAKCLSLVAETVDQVASRLTQRLKNTVRLVEEHEEVQAGTTRYLVENTLTMHSRNAIHVAEEVVKIDAGQVHLG